MKTKTKPQRIPYQREKTYKRSGGEKRLMKGFEELTSFPEYRPVPERAPITASRPLHESETQMLSLPLLLLIQNGNFVFLYQPKALGQK